MLKFNIAATSVLNDFEMFLTQGRTVLFDGEYRWVTVAILLSVVGWIVTSVLKEDDNGMD